MARPSSRPSRPGAAPSSGGAYARRRAADRSSIPPPAAPPPPPRHLPRRSRSHPPPPPPPPHTPPSHPHRRPGARRAQAVGVLARGDLCHVAAPVTDRRGGRRHDQGVLWRYAVLGRDPRHLVDVTLLADEARLAIGGAEHAARGAVALDQRQKAA